MIDYDFQPHFDFLFRPFLPPVFFTAFLADGFLSTTTFTSFFCFGPGVVLSAAA
jgi:hypothetical protein